tara:strand:+ start:1177 stop:1461 length:285 start_codon:yes stop_codon:yes gene_type:complete
MEGSRLAFRFKDPWLLISFTPSVMSKCEIGPLEVKGTPLARLFEPIEPVVIPFGFTGLGVVVCSVAPIMYTLSGTVMIIAALGIMGIKEVRRVI